MFENKGSFDVPFIQTFTSPHPGQAGQASPSQGQIATNNGPGGQAGKAVGSDIELAVSGTIIGTIG